MTRTRGYYDRFGGISLGEVLEVNPNAGRLNATVLKLLDDIISAP